MLMEGDKKGREVAIIPTQTIISSTTSTITLKAGGIGLSGLAERFKLLPKRYLFKAAFFRLSARIYLIRHS
jgi:hypothetical protein